jgi:hypothetical protein
LEIFIDAHLPSSGSDEETSQNDARDHPAAGHPERPARAAHRSGAKDNPPAAEPQGAWLCRRARRRSSMHVPLQDGGFGRILPLPLLRINLEENRLQYPYFAALRSG